MAHYPNDKGEYKTKRVETKWYPDDLAEIDRQAKRLNLTRTEYITKCVLSKTKEISENVLLNAGKNHGSLS